MLIILMTDIIFILFIIIIIIKVGVNEKKNEKAILKLFRSIVRIRSYIQLNISPPKKIILNNYFNNDDSILFIIVFFFCCCCSAYNNYNC